MTGIGHVESLAHELGHVFGLKDIYDGYIDSHGRHVQSQDMEPNICGDDFFEKPADWNLETGYGFYESGDTRIRIVRKLLMYGFLSSGLDVPAGSVRGVPTATPPLASLTHIPVGKASIITNALEGH